MVGAEFDTKLIIAPTMRSEGATHCKIDFYHKRGPLLTRQFDIAPNGGLVLDVEREVAQEMPVAPQGHAPVWFYLDADRSDIGAHAVTTHRQTGNTTVEHTF
ncbi:MAG: hypothetical protein NVS9B12_06780 [Vulcanimicrobiaceae bacterium]